MTPGPGRSRTPTGRLNPHAAVTEPVFSSLGSATVRGSMLPDTARRGQAHSNHLHESFYDGRSCKEQGTNKPPPTGRVRERSEGGTTCLATSQNPSLQHPSWLNKVCTTRKDSESK